MSLTKFALSHFSCCCGFFCKARMSAQHLSRLSMERLCMLSMRMERLCVLRGASVCAQYAYGASVCARSPISLCMSK